MRRGGWAELYRWQVDRPSPTPVFRQIYAQIRSAILSHAFAPGTKLPSSRELAARLSVARVSVISAYEQLLAEGFLFTRTGSGTYVSSDLPEPIEIGTKSSNARLPIPKHGVERPIEATTVSNDRPFNTARMLVDGRTIEIWRKLTNQAMRSFGSCHLSYSDPCGFMELRVAICEYVRVARAVRCEPEQVIVTAGSQQALDISIRALLRSGDEVVVEDPGYPLTQHALADAGIKIRPVPVDAEGIDVARAIRSAPRASAAVVTPSLQYPTGVMLSMARRLDLLAWARERGSWIIEDDWASEYRYSGRPLASLQGLDDADRVIYFGTLNKTLFPGLRIGYVVVPHPLLRAFAAVRYLMDRQPPSVQQLVLTEFMRQGHLAAHVRRMRLVYRGQRDLLAGELHRRAGSLLTIDAPDQGMHLVAYLRTGISDVLVEQAARERGIVVRAMSPLYKKAPPRSALILGFSGYPPQRLAPAAAQLIPVIKKHSSSYGGSKRRQQC